MSFLKRLFGKKTPKLEADELAARLDVPIHTLRGVPRDYVRFTIPKRSGGTRTIEAPNTELKQLQRRILRRLLERLKAHGAATGFQRGHSIVSHAGFHAGQAVLLSMDIADFFPNTTAKRVNAYFQDIGWSREAAGLLETLCCHEGHLPQGAPTSPRLSNVVNYAMDARLSGLAEANGARYSRYADDMTFSFAQDDRNRISRVIRETKTICGEFGYKLHQKKKLRLRRNHQQQRVTGLVVNERPALPRSTRRWLRAVEHRMAHGGNATLTPDQLAGWRALQYMILLQRGQE